MTPLSRIRNFSIVAHIDHGKSTLADRLIQSTGTVQDRDMKAQLLDSMDIERERGITIKANTVRIDYKADDGQTYVLNLIDTPGHVDFAYEVSRSMRAVEGSLLVVDSTQGVEAQTLANVYQAIDAGHEIVPVLNKIDLPAADCDRVAEQIEDVIGIEAKNALRVSAKSGIGIKETLESIVRDLPPPKGDANAPLTAMLVDSWYDSYLGVVVLVRIMDGMLRKNDRVKFMSNGTVHQVDRIGVFRPKMENVDELGPGEIGFITAQIKQVRDTRVGDTITNFARPTKNPLGGYKDPKPMVFSGLFPLDGADFPVLRDALEKLQLNDAALVYEPESSAALGFGFRCGFLGLLHMEIVRERLEREAKLNLISTAPNVVYRVTMEDGKEHIVTNPSEFPDGKINNVKEPIVKSTILAPAEFIGTIMELCQDRRGVMLGMDYISEDRVEIRYTLPLAEIVFDFFDQLKSRTRGYASLDYEEMGDEEGNLVKVDILLQGEAVDAFSAIVHRDKAYSYGVMMTGKLRELIPRQQFEVPIQAAIGSRIIARESIRAIRKDVLAKCYGGDISRKRKLLEKQKEGKKRMKMVGRVEVPQEAFVAALATDADIEKIKAARKLES